LFVTTTCAFVAGLPGWVEFGLLAPGGVLGGGDEGITALGLLPMEPDAAAGAAAPPAAPGAPRTDVATKVINDKINICVFMYFLF
jgi:hypothetical protein